RLGRRRGAEILSGVGSKRLATELIGARLGIRCYRSARDLVVLRLVVGSNDLVFADGQLWKRIALAVELTADATFEHVVLLTDAVDEDVDGAVRLAPTAQGGGALRVHRELHTRHRVGELQEV